MTQPIIPRSALLDRETGEIIETEGELSTAEIDRLILAVTDPRPMYQGNVPIYG